MKLPNGTQAIVELAKLTEYCLDPEHPEAGTRHAFSLRVSASRSRMRSVLRVAATVALLDVVALLSDLPAHGLVRGQVGTVVELLADDTVEVEFTDDEGRTYAELALRVRDLLVLHHRLIAAA